MRRAGILLAVSASFAVVSASGAAGASLVTVSGPDPYAACSTAAETGTNFADTEVEPQVAVNPTNGANIIGAWQQDRWSDGGAQGLVAGFSSNGGKSWGESTLPFSACAPGAIDDPFTGSPYNRASDPWVSFGPDGTAYASAVLVNDSNEGLPGTTDTGVATATSGDGGKTWGSVRLEKSDQGTTPVFGDTQFFNDKASITADPDQAGVAYLVWDRTKSPSSTLSAILNAQTIRGPAWFSKTSDFGRTWTTARPIFDPGERNTTLGNIIVVDPRNGTLYDFFAEFANAGNPNRTPRGISIAFIKSTDGGNTWSHATNVSTQDVVFDADPNTGQLLRTEEELPSVAIDPATGQLYVVWEDARFTGGTVNQIVISTSTDGGATWSAPAAVSGSQSNGMPAFNPTVAVNANGTVGVTYYDMRNLPAGDTTTLPTDVWLTTSTDHGATFGNETHVAGSFDMLSAPQGPDGFFLGDYEALGVSGTAFMPFFATGNTGADSNPTDILTGSF